uniref:Uncharacterized protein n=1 Tax=Kalanchoe fedtschenkoi TaxID=63787 RepID=A0A7N0UEW3_KALFE
MIFTDPPCRAGYPLGSMKLSSLEMVIRVKTRCSECGRADGESMACLRIHDFSITTMRTERMQFEKKWIMFTERLL